MKWFDELQFRKNFQIGRLLCIMQMRPKDRMLGRLGGGWKWVLGINCGRSQITIELFVMSITMRLMSKLRARNITK